MAICTAYGVTEEDVEAVLRANASAVADAKGRTFEAMASELMGELDHGLVEAAALHGDEFDDQVVYANEEIARQLRALGTLEPLRPEFPLGGINPREIEASLKARCPVASQVELLYATRDAFVDQLAIRGLATASDLAQLDRLGRFKVASKHWGICDPGARAALREDVHHQVRSCAALNPLDAPFGGVDLG